MPSHDHAWLGSLFSQVALLCSSFVQTVSDNSSTAKSHRRPPPPFGREMRHRVVVTLDPSRALVGRFRCLRHYGNAQTAKQINARASLVTQAASRARDRLSSSPS